MIIVNFEYEHLLELIEVQFEYSRDGVADFDIYTNDFKNIFKKLTLIIQELKNASLHFSKKFNIQGYTYSPSTDKRGRLYDMMIHKIDLGFEKINYDFPSGIGKSVYYVKNRSKWLESLQNIYNKAYKEIVINGGVFLIGDTKYDNIAVINVLMPINLIDTPK